jgi:hypothetical protein
VEWWNRARIVSLQSGKIWVLNGSSEI